MPSSYASMLSFLLASLIPISLSAAGNGAAPFKGGFSLPLVSNHHELNHTADGLFGYVLQRLPPASGAANLTTIMRPPLAPVVWPSYAVQVGVGTGHGRHFYRLALDTVGGLTWMRCKPCVPDLPQESPAFDSASSPGYENVMARTHYCVSPYTASPDGRCSFDVAFHGASALGYLGKDGFTFAGSGGPLQTLPGIVFGCAHTTHGFQNHDRLAGVLSLSRHQTSLIRQLSLRGVGQFSYCLFGRGQGSRHGFLRFGDDIPHPTYAEETAILYANAMQLYLIRVVGISLDGRKLKGIKSSMFTSDGRGNGGSIIDVGKPSSRMIQAAYDILEHEVAAHLWRHGVRRAPVPGHRLCVHDTPGIHARLPSVALNFYEGSSFTIKPELLFLAVSYERSQYLCFSILPDQHRTVVGAIQQVDTRFTFDLNAKKIFFAPEQCYLDTSAAS